MRLTLEFEADDPRQAEFVAGLKRRYAALIDDDDPDLVVTVGGDGAMLRALHRRTPPPGVASGPVRFLGIGRGSRNFLMNPESVAERLADLDPASLAHHRLHPLWVEMGDAIIGPAYNDVILGNGVVDWHSFRLDSADGAFERYEMRSSGLCVSTPLGSTAFNANNRGAVLPLDQPLLSITGICANRDLSEIFAGSELAVGFESRRGVSLFIDGRHMRTLGPSGQVTIRRDERQWMDLAFIDEGDFSRRRIERLKAKRF